MLAYVTFSLLYFCIAIIDCWLFITLGMFFSGPITLDPNTANPFLSVSDDLTSVTVREEEQKLPDNAERLDACLCILGSESFNSGTHWWDVEVGDCDAWSLGVMTESAQRTGDINSRIGLWYMWYYDGEYGGGSTPQPHSLLSLEHKLQRIRVQLDWDRGRLSFADPLTGTHIHTFTHKFTDKLLPYLALGSKMSALEVLPIQNYGNVNHLTCT